MAFIVDGTNGLTFPNASVQTVAATAPGLAFLSSATASSSATVDLTTGFSSAYNNYYVTFENCTGSTPSGLGFQIFLAGVVQTGSVYGYQNLNFGSFGGATSGQPLGLFKDMNTNASNETLCGYLNVFDANNTRSRVPMFLGYSVRSDSTNAAFLSVRYGSSTTSAITGIRFLPQSGNIATGTFRLYGIANS